MKRECQDKSEEEEGSKMNYQYEPKNEKKYKTYTAESVIANNGESNTVALNKDKKLFCNETVC